MSYLRTLLSGSDVSTPLREKMEHDIYLKLLKLCPGLEDRVKKSSDQEIHYIADMVGPFNESIGELAIDLKHL